MNDKVKEEKNPCFSPSKRACQAYFQHFLLKSYILKRKEKELRTLCLSQLLCPVQAEGVLGLRGTRSGVGEPGNSQALSP